MNEDLKCIRWKVHFIRDSVPKKKCVSVSDYWQFYSPLITLFNIASSFRILSEPDDFRSISHLEKYHHLGIFVLYYGPLHRIISFGSESAITEMDFLKKVRRVFLQL